MKKSIGTVYTFHGKETTIVIIYLGVGEDHEGAANWASNSPDILNVAVTRAKNRVIIVGNKNCGEIKNTLKKLLKNLVED